MKSTKATAVSLRTNRKHRKARTSPCRNILASSAAALLALFTMPDASVAATNPFTLADFTRTQVVGGPVPATVWTFGGVSWTTGSTTTPSTSELVSSVFTFTAATGGGPAALAFNHARNFENTFDGGILEMSVNGGAFVQVGGAAFTQNSYNSTLSSSFGNPLGGSAAFSNNVAAQDSKAKIGSFAVGDTVQFRWRGAWDSSVLRPSPNWTLNSAVVLTPDAANFWLGGASSTWTGANWTTDAAGTTPSAVGPGTITDVTFSATGAANQNTTLGADFAIKSLTVKDATAVTIGGANTLTLAGNAGTGIDVQSGAGLFTLDANLTLGGASDTITVNNAAGAVINGVIGGSNGLIKDGIGILTLAGTNIYTGATTITAGTLAVNGSIAAASTVAVGTAGTLTGTGTVNGNATVTGGGIINLGLGANIVGSLTVDGGLWNGAGTVGGDVNVNSGNLSIGSGANLTTNGTVNVSGASTLSATDATSTITGSLNYTSTANSLFIGAITGAGSGVTLNIPGATSFQANQLDLRGNNTYGGATQVISGTLRVSSSNGISGSGVTVSDGATLDIANGANVGVIPLSLRGGGNDSGGPVGALFGASGSGTVGYAGAITLAGDARIGMSGGNGFNLTGGIDNAGFKLTLGTPTQLANRNINLNGIISGSGDVVVDHQIANYNASNTYTGSTSIINGGTLNANVAGALPAPVVDGGTGTVRSAIFMDQSGSGSSTLNINANQAIAALTGAASSSVVLGANILTIGMTGGTIDFAGVISDGALGGSLIKDGTSTQILSGANTYTGGTTVSVATLLANNTVGSATGTGAVTVQSGATLGGSGFITGQVTIDGGGHLAPGNSPGTLNTGTLVLSSGAISDFELGVPYTIGGGVNDLVNVTGNLTLDGVLNVTDAGAFGPGAYRLFNYTGALTDNTLDMGTVPAGFVVGDFIIQTAVAGSVNLIAKLNAITPVFWDGMGAPGDGTISGGSGIWNATNINWADPSGNFNVPWTGTTGIFAAPGGTVTVDGTLAFEALQFMDNGYVVDATVGSSLTPTGAATITIDAGVLTQISAPFSGPGSIEKLGTGVLWLTGASNYTGGTTITAGTLQLGDGIALGASVGTGDVTIGIAGTFTLNLANGETIANNILDDGHVITDGVAPNNYTVAGNISGNGDLTKMGTNVVTLTGTNTYLGATTVAGGTLQIGDALTAAAINAVSAVDVQAGATLLLVNLQGDIFANNMSNSVAGTGVVEVNSANVNTISGTLSDGVGILALTQSGPGTTILTAGNTYTGATTVAAGALQIGDAVTAGAISALSAVDVQAGAILLLVNLQGNVFANNVTNSVPGFGTVEVNSANTNILSGTLSNGAGVLSLTQSGPGRTILTADNTNSGATTITAGVLQVGNGGTTGTTGIGGGQIINNATLVYNRSDVFAETNLISGTGALIQLGTGTTVLAGVNTYTGPTTVNGGTLAAGSTQAFGMDSATTVNANATLDLGGNNNFIGSLAGGGAASFVQSSGGPATLSAGGLNTSTTYSGVVQDGTGRLAFIKVGTGTQTLAGANTYTGGTAVTGGTLAAANAKAFGSGNLTMVVGTLKTTGGPLSVNIGAGNILFSGGTFVANVGGLTPGVTHDQLVTTGSANISGSTLALVQQNGFLLAPGEKVVLISAAAGVAGGSASGTAVAASNVAGLAAFSNSGLLVPVVNLYADSVVLEVAQGSFVALAGTLGFTPNQLAVAAALDSVAARIGSKTGVFRELNFLDTQPTSTLAANLDKMAPDELTSIFNIAVSLANVQTANITRRLEDIRSEGGGGGTVAGAVTTGGGARGPVGKRGKAIVAATEPRLGMWFTGSGEFTRVGSTTNAAGFDLDSGGVTAGVDYRFTEHFAAGISLGYMNTAASLVNGGKVDVDGGRVGAYATYFNGGLHVDASVSGGPNSYRTRRTTPNNTVATGGPEGNEVNLLFATGYDWKMGALTIGPTASIQYTNVQLDGFTETGTFAPLSVARRNADSLRSALGFHATFDAKVGRAIIRPEVRAAWQHEYGDTSYSLTSSFATLGGNPFTVSGPAIGRDSVLVGAGVSVLWNHRFSTYAFYDAELARTNYTSHNVSVGFRLKF